MNTLIVIPARYASERFPGKPLEQIAGKSMIQRVYEQCDKSKATDVIVATDDRRIFEHVVDFGGNACMTSGSHTNGTERIIEAVERLLEEGEEYEVIVNVQGDEPLTNPRDINRLIDVFEDDDTDIATLVSAIKTPEDIDNPNVVKVVLSEEEDGVADALYFSRSPIPYNRSQESDVPYYKHHGTYAFSVDVLLSLKMVPESSLERAEKLEQLRWLQNHYVVSAISTNSEAIGVDTPSDVAIVEKLLKRK